MEKSKKKPLTKDEEIGIKLTYLFNTLNGIFKDTTKAKRQTINKISSELDLSVDKIKIIWNKNSYLKDIK